MCDPEDEPRDIAWCLGTEAETMGLPARQGESRHGSGDIKRQRGEGGSKCSVKDTRLIECNEFGGKCS